MIKSAGNWYFPILIFNCLHPEVATISPPGELTLRGFPMFSTARPCLFTNALEMNECDAPVSNNTIAGNVLSKNVPITTSGSSNTSSTYVVHMSLLERVGLGSSLGLSFRTLSGIMSLILALETDHLADVPLGFMIWAMLSMVRVMTSMSVSPVAPHCSP